MRPHPTLTLSLTVLLCTHTHASNLTEPALPPAPCNEAKYAGPSVLTDLPLYKEGHLGPRVIDYGIRLLADELQRPLRVECRVLPDTAPVAQWIARPPPKGQVAGSIPARGTKF
jgi:hypothetical protein